MFESRFFFCKELSDMCCIFFFFIIIFLQLFSRICLCLQNYSNSQEALQMVEWALLIKRLKKKKETQK